MNEEWKITKKNIQLVAATVMVTASFLGIFYRFTTVETNQANNKKATDLRMTNIEINHDNEITTLKDEMKLAFEFINSRMNDDNNDNKRRTNTIRDRTDERLNQLERSNSDSQ